MSNTTKVMKIVANSELFMIYSFMCPALNQVQLAYFSPVAAGDEAEDIMILLGEEGLTKGDVIQAVIDLTNYVHGLCGHDASRLIDLLTRHGGAETITDCRSISKIMLELYSDWDNRPYTIPEIVEFLEKQNVNVYR